MTTVENTGKIKKIAVLTSGGDAPGMNAVIRAVVRTAKHFGLEVLGVKRGYDGLLSGDVFDMHEKSVSDIIHKGGTILLTARSSEMRTEEGQKKAANICNILGIDALVVIGGDGSITGGLKLARLGVNVIGIPATIDLDLDCSEYTIGFDTAVNTAMEAINKIRDTSFSHERCSVVEVMGRNSGEIALWCAMTCGAEEVLIPENPIEHDIIIAEIFKNRAKGKRHHLVIVAEGSGHTEEFAKKIEEVTGIETRASILGYLQRGGSPTAMDRRLGSLMGYKAVESLINGEKNRIVVIKNNDYKTIDIEEGLNQESTYSNKTYDIIKILSV